MKKILMCCMLIFVLCLNVWAANTPTVQNVTALGGDIQNSKIPIYISGDTIDTLTCITRTPCVITEIYWYGATSIGHLMAVKDADGNMLFPMYCGIANHGQHTGQIRIPAPGGIYMDNLDSGAVLIVIETN